MTVGIEQPPGHTDYELAAYLVRQFRKHADEIERSGFYPPRSIFPRRATVGEVYYFSQAIPTTPITGEGLWLYKSTGWVLIA